MKNRGERGCPLLFHAAKTLSHCLDSVRNQTISVEHILIDGRSSDGTLEIAEKYKKHLFKIVSEPDNGIYDAMNKGISLATGEKKSGDTILINC